MRASLSEVMVFFVSKHLNRRFNAWTLIRIGCAVCICRWILFPMHWGIRWLLRAGSVSMPAALPACIPACRGEIVATVQETQESSAQGAYFFYNGMFMGLMTLASGYIYTWLGLASFYVMALVAVLGMSLVFVAYYLQPQRLVSGGQTREAV